jgi:hypothetical protein
MAAAEIDLYDNYFIKALLSILQNEYKRLTVGGLVRSGEGDIDDYMQADLMTSKRSLI